MTTEKIGRTRCKYYYEKRQSKGVGPAATAEPASARPDEIVIHDKEVRQCTPSALGVARRKRETSMNTMVRSGSSTHRAIRLCATRRLICSVVLAASAMLPSAGFAKVEPGANNLNSCRDTVAGWNSQFGGGYSIRQHDPYMGEPEQRYVIDGSGLAYDLVVIKFQYDLLYPQGGFQFCQEFMELRTYNDPGGAPAGSSNPYAPPLDPNFPLFPPVKVIDNLCGIAGAICIPMQFYPPIAPICTAIGIACGGAYFLSLKEHSPVWSMAYTDGMDTIPEAMTVPFKVANVGDGDWLALAVNGVEYFRQPLSAFDVDTVHFAAVPTSLLVVGAPAVWTFYLDSAGESNAEGLIFDVEPEQPADPIILVQHLLNDVSGVGPGKSLANKAALARTYYAANDIPATCAVLTDFVSELMVQAGKKKLTTTQAAALTADASAIMETVGCN